MGGPDRDQRRRGIFAGFALGAPDCQSAGVFDGQSATFTDWRRAFYEGLADLLGTVTPGGGDAATEEMLASADIIAFEMMGTPRGLRAAGRARSGS